MSKKHVEFVGKALVWSSLLLMPAMAVAGVDGIAIDGESKVTELGAFTTLIVTVAELAEDYIFPVGAIVVLGASFWSLFFRRDMVQFAIGMFVAIGLGASAFFMQSIIAAFAT